MHDKLLSEGMLDERQLRKAAREVHEVLEWLDVYETEYSLPTYMVDEIRARLEHIEMLLGEG